MQDNRNDELRKKAAAENLERRRQEIRAGKKKNRRKPKQAQSQGQKPKQAQSQGQNPKQKQRQKQNLLKLFILIGGILIICLVLMIACTGISRIAERAAKEKAEREAAQAEAGEIVIGLKGSATQLVCEGEPYIENGAFAIDTAEGEGAIPEAEIKIKGKVDTSKAGDYTVKYTAKGTSGKAVIERTVTVLPEEEYGEKAENVPVMMYHWVYTESDVPDELDGNWILDTALDEQMAWLKENEFYYPGWKELRAWIDGEISLPSKSTVITFDDGTEAFLKNGVPVLEKYEIPATSFIICWKKNSAGRKIRQYASPYIDFESHTFALHDKLDQPENGFKGVGSKMSNEEILEDLGQAAEKTGNNDAFAYPYGEHTDAMVEAVREQGVLCAFTVEYDRVRRGMDPLLLPRIRVLGDESFQIWKESVY